MKRCPTVNYTLVITIALSLLAACDPGDPSSNNTSTPDLGTVDEGSPNNEDETPAKVELVDPIKIMTWNVEKFWDVECDTGGCGDNDFEQTFSPAEFSFHGSQISDAVKRDTPDILLLQELEKEVCIEEVANNLGFDETAFGETFFNSSLDVGVATRGTITETVLHREDTVLQRRDGGTEKFAREFLEVHIEIDGREVIVFNAHFKAKFNDDPGWREAEALGAHAIVTRVAQENPESLVVMGGDLNDTPGSPPLNALTEELTLVSSDETWTYAYRGEEQAIDHLLMAPNENVGLVEDSVVVIRDAGGFGLSVSDHAALVATFGFVP